MDLAVRLVIRHLVILKRSEMEDSSDFIIRYRFRLEEMHFQYGKLSMRNIVLLAVLEQHLELEMWVNRTVFEIICK